MLGIKAVTGLKAVTGFVSYLETVYSTVNEFPFLI